MEIERVKAEFQLVSEIRENDELIKLDPKYVVLPSKKRKEDAGYDLISAQDGTIPAHGEMVFHTGVKLAVPFGWWYEIKGRSGLGFKGIQPFIGTIDATYSGLIRVLLSNHTDSEYHVHKGDKIAQIVFHKQYEMEPCEVDTFSEGYCARGTAGFGSSGR